MDLTSLLGKLNKIMCLMYSAVSGTGVSCTDLIPLCLFPSLNPQTGYTHPTAPNHVAKPSALLYFIAQILIPFYLLLSLGSS